MKNEALIELYKTQEGRYEIILDILKQDKFSIAQIVEVKERAMTETLHENDVLISGLAFRSTAMFGMKPKDVLENIELIKPLVAKDIIKSGVVRGTPFEKELLEKYPPKEE